MDSTMDPILECIDTYDFPALVLLELPVAHHIDIHMCVYTFHTLMHIYIHHLSPFFGPSFLTRCILKKYDTKDTEVILLGFRNITEVFISIACWCGYDSFLDIS